MNIKRNIKNSALWQSVEVLALMFIQLGYFAVMARLLDIEDFGLMAVTNSIILLGGVFAESGMGAAVIQRKNLTGGHINAAYQGGIIIGLCLFVSVYFSSSFLARFLSLEALEDIVKVSAVSFFFLSASSVSIGILQKNFQFKLSAMVTMLSALISYGAGIVFALQGQGVWALVYASLMFTILKFFGYLYVAPVKIKFGFFIKEWKDLFGFGFGITLLKINNYLGSSGLNLFLAKIMPVDILGVFDRAYQLKTLPSKYLGNIIDKIMFPAMSSIQDEKEKLFRVYQHGLGLSNALLMPVSVYLIFFSEEIVLVMLGEKWRVAVVPLMIMFVVLPMSISGRMADSLVRSIGLIYRNVGRKLAYIIVLLSATSFGAYQYGIIGAAIGVTIGYTFNYVYMLFMIKSIFNKNFSDIFYKPIREAVIVSLFCLIFLFFIELLLSQFIIDAVWVFIVSTVMMGLAVFSIAFFKPGLFGSYISVTIKEISTKTSRR